VKVKISTVPNIISAIRVFSIPAFYLTFKNRLVFISSLILIFTILTDILDGYLARKYSAVSKLGTFLDHGVDKLISITLSFLLYYFYHIPNWAFYFFVIRDFLIIIVGSTLFLGFGLAFSSLWLGKIAGAFYYGMVFGYLLNFSTFARFCLIISIILFGIVIIVYPLKYFPVLKKTFLKEKGVVSHEL
jgi:cardiolipin synthase